MKKVTMAFLALRDLLLITSPLFPILSFVWLKNCRDKKDRDAARFAVYGAAGIIGIMLMVVGFVSRPPSVVSFTPIVFGAALYVWGCVLQQSIVFRKNKSFRVWPQ